MTPPRQGPAPSIPVPDLAVNGNGRHPTLHVDVEHPVDVLAVLDRRGRITFLSPSAERLLGLDVAALVGSQALHLFDEESSDLARALFADLVMGRRLSVLLEVSVEGPDGGPVHLELVASGRMQPHGGVVLSLRLQAPGTTRSGRPGRPRPTTPASRGAAPAASGPRPTRRPSPVGAVPTDGVGGEARPAAAPRADRWPGRTAERAVPVPPASGRPRAPFTPPPTRPAPVSPPTAPVPAAGADRWPSTFIESLAEGVMVVDRQGAVRQVNEAFEVMFEAPRVRVVGRRLDELLLDSRELGVEVEDDGTQPGRTGSNPVARAMETGRRSVDAVYRVHRPGRPAVWVRANAQPLFDDAGRVAGAVASFVDITVVRQAASRLRRQERFSQVLLDTLDEGIVACDAEGRLTVFNPAARRLHGLADDEDPLGSFPPDGSFRHPDGEMLAPGEHPLLRALSGEQLRDAELLLEAHDGTACKVLVNGEALVDDGGRRLGAVIAVHDVTEQKRNEERLAELALHDPLTSLGNRTLLAERLQDAIDGLARRTLEVGPDGPDGEPAPGVAVYLLDLDEFKQINDGLGHDVGDEVLVAVGRRLSAIVRPSDTVARLGGDEFVVLCDVEGGEEEMVRIGERISDALARPYRIEGRTITVLASVGGVFVDNPDTDPSKLLSRADDAMYGVKWSRRRQRRSMAD